MYLPICLWPLLTCAFLPRLPLERDIPAEYDKYVPHPSCTSHRNQVLRSANQKKVLDLTGAFIFFLIRTEALYNRRACAKANQQVQKDLQKLSHCLYILLLLSCWKLHISFKDISMQSCCKCLLHTGPTKKQFCKTLTISRLIVWNFLQSLLRWGIFFDIHWNYITAPLLVFWGSLAWNYRHLADWCWLGQLRQNQRS